MVSPAISKNPDTVRAHIRVTAVDLVRAEPGEVLESRVHFQNDGKTPIKELRNYIVMAVLPYSEDVKTQMALEDKLLRIPMMVIGIPG